MISAKRLSEKRRIINHHTNHFNHINLIDKRIVRLMSHKQGKNSFYVIGLFIGFVS